MERYHTESIFPEYSADCDIDVSQILKEDFNVRTLFTGSCDFSSLSKDPVFCSEIRHIAKLEVDKTGIEGAAVTVMAFEGASAPEREYTDIYETFVVDKEFGFVLTYSDSILFSGIVTNID